MCIEILVHLLLQCLPVTCNVFFVFLLNFRLGQWQIRDKAIFYGGTQIINAFLILILSLLFIIFFWEEEKKFINPSAVNQSIIDSTKFNNPGAINKVSIDVPDFHVISKGDNIYRIAEKYHVFEEDILKWNPGLNPNTMQIGQKIILKEELVNLNNLGEEKVENQPNSGTPFHQILSENDGVTYFAIGIQQQANTKELFEIAEKNEVSYISNLDCETFSSELRKQLIDFTNNIDYLYITIDLDGFSSAFAPGVSAPSSLGFTPIFVYKVLAFLMETKKVISLINAYGKRLDSSYQIKLKDYQAAVADFEKKQNKYLQ